MSFEYKPVSLEEYNQTLRDSVNAYYTHAMNDPNMSNEDALKSTGEMAEQYLDAVQEFQETQEMGNIETTNEDVSITDNGLDGVDDSMDI
ncbi:hypothetical protein DXC27_06325 [Ruminococcus sp. OM08-7]|jgi:hypothetical protein|nr:hypothetical protein DWV90_08530 [Ruminococcus sp. AF13-37]RGW22519.1 hypothetical protein DWV87_07105 [Ruminococcus sp. AF13-28]RHU88374.1 hypothetical protein DXC27_06325 [Ruminococcus sp. OM08-7]